MKKRVLFAVAAGMLLMSAAGCGSDKDKSESSSSSTREENTREEADEEILTMPVTFVNNTDIYIYSLYSSSTDTNDWEEDLLDEEVMAPGEYALVNFYYTSDSTVWDFAAEDSDGNKLEFYDLDFEDYDEDDGVTVYLNDDGTAEIMEGADDYTAQ